MCLQDYYVNGSQVLPLACVVVLNDAWIVLPQFLSRIFRTVYITQRLFLTMYGKNRRIVVYTQSVAVQKREQKEHFMSIKFQVEAEQCSGYVCCFPKWKTWYFIVFNSTRLKKSGYGMKKRSSLCSFDCTVRRGISRVKKDTSAWKWGSPCYLGALLSVDTILLMGCVYL